MPEEFTITINKRGEIWIDLRGLGQQRVRELRQMLEEMIGPIAEPLALADESPGPAVRFVSDQGEERYRIRKE